MSVEGLENTGVFVLGALGDFAAPKDIVRHNEATWVEAGEGGLEGLEVVDFMQVDQDEVPGAGELGKDLKGIALVEVDAVFKGVVIKEDFVGVEFPLIFFSTKDLSAALGKKQGGVAPTAAKFKDPLGTAQAGEQAQDLATLPSDQGEVAGGGVLFKVIQEGIAGAKLLEVAQNIGVGDRTDGVGR